MKVLIIGSGGREHALSWKISQSSKVDCIYVAPGNAGTAKELNTLNVAIKADDIDGLTDFATKNSIDLTIVGPEAPLAMGIVDRFKQSGLTCLGPDRYAAQLESSKSFSKAFMRQHNIPTADYASFTRIEEALNYLETCQYPQVIKANGLAAGKGVIIVQSKQQAQTVVNDMLSGATFGDAGKEIVIEQFLTGIEASFIVLCDGETAVPLASSQDHKARDDGDKGPNTGGMGAYSPAPIIDEQLHQRIMKQVIEPTLAGMKKAGHPFVGFLYAGLMVSDDGSYNVLEFNCRFGDPETQPILFRLNSDFVELCQLAIAQSLAKAELNWDDNPALCVVLAAKGYPDAYHKGDEIQGLFSETANAKVFHAATSEQDNKVITNGGRVLGITVKAPNLAKAQQKVYELLKPIHWQHGVYYRRDIGDKGVNP